MSKCEPVTTCDPNLHEFSHSDLKAHNHAAHPLTNPQPSLPCLSTSQSPQRHRMHFGANFFGLSLSPQVQWHSDLLFFLKNPLPGRANFWLHFRTSCSKTQQQPRKGCHADFFSLTMSAAVKQLGVLNFFSKNLLLGRANFWPHSRTSGCKLLSL